MTSLLAFAWRRRSNAPSSPSKNTGSNNNNASTNEEAPSSPTLAPPVLVTASTSTDMSHDDACLTLSESLTPRTPEGLRPRPCSLILRRELSLPSAATAVPWLSRDLGDAGVSVLPPRPSSSWSLEGMLSSPPVSTNSFYARNNNNNGQDDNVAGSPHLLPGQARTAVGALVAQQQQQQYGPNDPSQWLSNNNNANNTNSYKQEPVHALSSMLPARQEWLQLTEQRQDECGEEVPYYALDQQHQQQHAAMNHNGHSDLDRILPISNHTSPAASPSSRARPLATFNRQQQDVNASFNSLTRLMQQDDNDGRGGGMAAKPHGYDFGPICVVPDGDRVAGTEVVLPHQSDHLTNMSAMSHSLADQESLYGNSRTVSHDEEDEPQFVVQDEPTTTTQPMIALDGALQHQKARNQRRVKEELVVAALERLQDDVQLVQDVQQVFGCNELASKVGLLQGFEQHTQTVIVRNLTTILNEMDSLPSEEFFMSPSQVPVYADTHDDLREALVFCRAMTSMAVPVDTTGSHQQGQGRWQFIEELRCALGIIPPESPEVVRGGDTSVFSLPSDSAETPMTSNVSMTTTITSAVTSPLRERARKARPDGLQMRRTIEVLATVLGKMSRACLGLSKMNGTTWNLGAEASIRLTEDIKRNYLQLLAIKNEDIKSLVDAFEFYLPPLAITREVSSDDQDEFVGSQGILPPPPVLMHAMPRMQDNSAGAFRFGAQVSHGATASAPANRRMSRTPNGIFSPSTDDMRTTNSYDEADCDQFDDLRRTIGSNDYGDEEELRDGCPPEEHNGAFPMLARCCSLDEEDYTKKSKRE